MRRAALLIILGLVACGDPGLRDRSLMAKLSEERQRLLPYGPSRAAKRKGPGQTSVIGLAPDQLAHYYPDDPSLVIRFRDVSSVGREAATEIERIRKTFPDLDLPSGAPADLLRRVLSLPDGILIDPVRPFAFVRVGGEWVAILPTRAKEKGTPRLRQLDAIYCVAGSVPAVQSYRAGFRKGFFLPGDVSILATPEGAKDLAALAAPLLGLDPAAAAATVAACPGDVERFDLALRLQEGLLRVDLRAAPGRESPTAVYLERMRPKPSGAVRWLPPRGTAYFEIESPPLDWEGLFAVMLRDTLPQPDEATEQRMFSIRRFLGALGRDAAAVVRLVPEGPTSVLLVADLEDPSATEAFLDSVDLVALLGWTAGPDGSLEWQRRAFDYEGTTVGMIQGNLSRNRLLAWRKSGDLSLATASVLMRGPVVAYVAIVGERLCVAIGPKSRSEMEMLIEHVRRGAPVDNDHAVEATSLFPQRLGGITVDLGALFDGCVEAAPAWEGDLAGLRNASLRFPVPASGAVTVEGGALRVAVHLRPALVAEAVSRLRAHLARK